MTKSDREIAEAIWGLPRRRGHFTQSGKPAVRSIEAALGRDISAADRDRVWAIAKLGRGNEPMPPASTKPAPKPQKSVAELHPVKCGSSAFAFMRDALAIPVDDRRRDFTPAEQRLFRAAPHWRKAGTADSWENREQVAKLRLVFEAERRNRCHGQRPCAALDHEIAAMLGTASGAPTCGLSRAVLEYVEDRYDVILNALRRRLGMSDGDAPPPRPAPPPATEYREAAKTMPAAAVDMLDSIIEEAQSVAVRLDSQGVIRAWRQSKLNKLRAMPFGDGVYQALPLELWKRIIAWSEIDKHEWEAGVRTCSNFAAKFAADVGFTIGVSAAGVVCDVSAGHAYNALLVASASGVDLRAFEPQTDRFVMLGQKNYQASEGFILFS